MMYTEESNIIRLSHSQFMELVTSREAECEEDIGYSLYHTTYHSSIDNPICKGMVKSIQIREGITFQTLEIRFHQDTVVEMISSRPQVGFIFYLEGESRAHIDKSNDEGKSPYVLHLKKQETAVYANTYSKGPQYYTANKKIRALFIHFDYNTFREMLADTTEELPKELAEALFDGTKSYLRTTTMPTALVTLCNSLSSNPFKGKSKEFYTEAKVIELIAYQLDTLARLEPAGKKPQMVLTQTEQAQIEKAYGILSERLANPPSLIDLAKKSGLSVYRLKNGLKLVYGDTPYRILSELRLQKAKALLEQGQMNVQEVALEVGFVSLGTFSNTFYDRFGFRPSAIRK